MTFRQSKQHGLLGRLAPVLTLFAVGCSLIVPLQEYVGTGTHAGGTSAGGGSGGISGSDTVGGTEGALGGTGGSTGGSVEVGGTGNGATSGNGAGGTGETGGSEAGTDNGGVADSGGIAGESQGGDSAGTTLGGTAGLAAGGTAESGGMSGGGASGGSGGLGGMGGVAGMGCGNPDFQMDPKNCGGCGITCGTKQECLEGICRSSPCDGVCAMYKTVKLTPGMGYRADKIGTSEVCTEVIGYAPASPAMPSFVCWNISTPRTIDLNNGSPRKCDAGAMPINVPLRVGGYCVHVTAGSPPEAGFQFP